MSQSTIFAVTSFDGNCQNLETSFFTFLIFGNVRHARTIAKDTHTDTHTQKETRP